MVVNCPSRRRLGVLTALALYVLSGVPCGAGDEGMRLIRAGTFRISQAQDRADGLRLRLLQRFGLQRFDRFSLAADAGGAHIELPLQLRLGSADTWELRLQPVVGTGLRRQGQRRFAATARMRTSLQGTIWSEGALKPALQLSMRAALSGRDVMFAAGRGTYQGRLTLTKHLGAWTLAGHGGLRSKQRLHGWRPESVGSAAVGSLSAAWRDERMEALVSVAGVRSRSARRATTVSIGGGMVVHPQAFASLLLRYGSDGGLQIQPGLTISL